jgi:hypothetical protein
MVGASRPRIARRAATHLRTVSRYRGSPFFCTIVLRLRFGVPSPSTVADCAGFCDRSHAAHASRSTRSSFWSSISFASSKLRIEDSRQTLRMAVRSVETVGCGIPNCSPIATWVCPWMYKSATRFRRSRTSCRLAGVTGIYAVSLGYGSFSRKQMARFAFASEPTPPSARPCGL